MRVAIETELNFHNHDEYKNILRALSKFKLDPAVFYTYENSLQIHFAFPDMKIGIMVHLDKDMVPGTMRINQSRLIPGKIMRKFGWEILDLTYKEFVEMGNKPALNYLKEWLELASDIQAEGGVIPRIAERNYL